MLMEEVFKVGVKFIKGYERSFIGSRPLFFYLTKEISISMNYFGHV